jgi:hypothetical protein
MTEAESRPYGAAPEHRATEFSAPGDSGTAFALPGRLPSSQQVCWWPVHEFAQRECVPGHPMVGTPAWCELADDNPAKLAACVDAAQHWALRVETCQQAECQASRAISASADWSAIGRRIRQRAQFFADKPYLKRRAS